MKGSFDDPIFGTVGQPADGGIVLDQDVSLSAGGGDKCRPRSKEGLMTSENSRVTVVEAPNQLPKFGRVSPIVNRVQDLFPYLGGCDPGPVYGFRR